MAYGTLSIRLLKLAITCFCIWIIVLKTDIHGVAAHVSAVSFWSYTMISAIILFQIFLFGLRWKLVARRCDAELSYFTTIRLTFVSMFFNQMLPGTIGGDTVRVIMSAQRGIAPGRAFGAVIIDRCVALFALALMVLASVPWLWSHLSEWRPVAASAFIATCVVIGATGVVTIGPQLLDAFSHRTYVRKLRDIVSLARNCFCSGDYAVAIVTLSVLIHLISASVAVILAYSLKIDVGVTAALILMLPSLLAMMLPISIGGWGVREGAIVFAFGQVGVAPADAFSLSVMFGLLYLLSGLPGAILWFFDGKKPAFEMTQLEASGA